MEAADFKFNLIDSYLGLLRSLSPENKMELISKLSEGSIQVTDTLACWRFRTL